MIDEGTGSEDGDRGAAADDPEALRREVERLRSKVAELGGEASPAVAPRARRDRRRRRASIALAIVAGLLLPVGTLTLWVRSQMLNTERYVETVTPLASDERIQEALVNRVTARVMEAADIEGLATELLPDRADRLAGLLAGGAESLTRSTVARIVESDEFEQLWINANREGHEGAVKILTGEGNDAGDAVVSRDGRVVLRIGPLVRLTLEQFDRRFGLGLADRVPAEQLGLTFVLVDSPDLARLNGQVRLFDQLAWLTAALALAALAGAALVAEDRRLGLRRVGLAISISMLVLLVGYALGRSAYLSNLPSGVQSPAAAAAAFDIMTRFLHQAIRSMFTLGVVVLAAVWLIGPSGSARTVRAWWGSLVGRVGDSGVELGPVPAWVAAHHSALRATILGAAAATLVVWTRPTGRVVLLVAVLALAALGIVQLLAAPGRRTEVATPDGSPPAG